MKKLRNAKIVTIILHGFIIIAAGHGVLILFISDILFPFFYITGEVDVNFTLTSDYTSRIPSVVVASFIGKITLIVSLFLKTSHWKHWFSIIGLLLLLLSFGLLTYGDWSYDSVFMLSFASGIPFILYFGYVFYLMYDIKKIS